MNRLECNICYVKMMDGRNKGPSIFILRAKSKMKTNQSMSRSGSLPEILAPVGGIDQLYAAVRCGADAVYFGTSQFNARRNGTNFDGQELTEIIKYCHVHGVKCHVTVNTIVTDSEIPALVTTIDEIAKAGADALIVQDLAVAKICHNRWPDLPLHASTQMTVHNGAGIDELERLGFTRAVLARELSISEIESIHKHNPMPLEVFVHGALCVCISGTCYLSSIIGGRSGNRGLCAQPCRTDFRIRNRSYALSLKDLCAIPHMNELINAGVSSFKIEGRMKRPEYVAAAVTACREMLSGRQPDLNMLKDVFSRDGFTDGYLTGKRTANMFGHRTAEDISASKEVYKKISAIYASEKQTIPVSMDFRAKAGERSSLSISDGTVQIHVEGVVPETAINVPLTEKVVRESLQKTGGTPFLAEQISIDVAPNISMPVASVKQLRRDGFSELEAVRGAIRSYPFNNYYPEITGLGIREPQSPILRIRLRSMEQYSDCFCKQQLQIPYQEVIKNRLSISKLQSEPIVELPSFVFPENEVQFVQSLEQLKKIGIRHVLSGNSGVLRYAKEFGFILHGDYALNISNSISAGYYSSLGITDLTASFEIPLHAIKKMALLQPVGILAYGYLPLMHFRSCPNRTEKGCSTCMGEIQRIKDGKNIAFYLGCMDRTYSVLYNGTPLYLGDCDLHGIDFATLYFTKETREQTEEVFRCYISGSKPPFVRTKGLYFRNLQ